MKTHVIAIIDASGSMSRYRKDTVGGFNSYIGTLIDDGGDYSLSTVLFSSRNYFHQHCLAVPLSDVKAELKFDDYTTRGNTALFDATAKAINNFVEAHPKLGDDEKVLVVSITDGEENDSIEYTAAGVKSMISLLEATRKWEFIYLSVGLDSWDQAASMGYNTNSYVGTMSLSDETVKAAYTTAAKFSTRYAGGASGQSVRSVMAEDVDESELRPPPPAA